MGSTLRFHSCSDQLVLGPHTLPIWFYGSNRRRVWSRIPIVVCRDVAYGGSVSNCRTAACWAEVEIVELPFVREREWGLVDERRRVADEIGPVDRRTGLRAQVKEEAMVWLDFHRRVTEVEEGREFVGIVPRIEKAKNDIVAEDETRGTAGLRLLAAEVKHGC